MPAAYDSWAYNMIAPALDLAQCAPTAVAGHDYTFTGWYKGNGQIKVVAYWRNADNLWAAHQLGLGRQGELPGRAPLDERHLLVRGPRRRDGDQRGLLHRRHVREPDGRHSYTIDDTSLVDDDAAPLASYALNVSTDGAGSGTRHEQPGRHHCGATCAASFTDGTSVTLTAAAAAGSGFTGWSGACAGASATCTVAMSQARAATATFARSRSS